MRVLVLYPWVVGDVSGAWLRLVSLVRYLKERGAEIHLFIPDQKESIAFADLKTTYFPLPQAAITIEAIAAGLAQQEAYKGFTPNELIFHLHFQIYRDNPAFAAALDGAIASADAVVMEYPFWARIVGPLCKKHGKPLLLTAIDALCKLHATNPKSQKLMLVNEVEAFRTADALFFVSEDDRAVFARHGVGGEVVPNGIDVEAITPSTGISPAAVLAETARKFSLPTSRYALFIGSRYHANEEAALKLKALAPRMEGVTVVVAGACLAPERTGNFISLGRVGDDELKELYLHASAILIPLQTGGGTSLKAIEAMAWGKPILATTVGVRGWGFEDGVHGWVVDDLERYPETIQTIVGDPSEGLARGGKARELALRNDFRRLLAPYGTALERLTGQKLSAPAKRGLVLVDNNLKGIYGHHFNYAKSIEAAAKTAGVPFDLFAAVDMAEEVASAFPAAVPAFRHGFHVPFFHPAKETPRQAFQLYDFTVANIEFHNDLVKVLHHARADDVLFMANVDHRQLMAWAWVLASWAPQLCPEVVLMLRYTYYKPSGLPANDGIFLDGAHALAVHGFSLLEQAARNKRVRLVTDSEGLAREYRPWTKLPIEVFPIPHTAPQNAESDGSYLPPKRAGRVRFVNLGDARGEKGIPILTRALQQLSQRPDFAKMEFVIQSFIGSHHHESMRPFVEEIKRLAGSGDNVALVERTLSEAEYHALLTGADVVLVPYERASYGARTSGVFTEAIANGKPVVVTDRTWMSGELGDSGAGVVFSDDRVENLTEAILTAARTYPELKAKTELLRGRYLAYHNPDSFMKALLHPPALKS